MLLLQSNLSSDSDLMKLVTGQIPTLCILPLYFLGEWRIILQTESINQRVGIDMCHHQNAPCSSVPDCGKKSRCVQRYNYQVITVFNIQHQSFKLVYFQFLLSLPSSYRPPKTSHCPSIRAFKFPSGCVCHAETSSEQNLVIDKQHSHFTF